MRMHWQKKDVHDTQHMNKNGVNFCRFVAVILIVLVHLIMALVRS